jgi:methionine-rich copper-binding protein CopC
MLSPTPGRRALLPVTVMFVLLGVATALAHARLLRSTPADKAMLQAAPGRVDFWFSELLDEGFNTVEVYPADELNTASHTNLASAGPVVDPADKTHLSATLRPLAAGSYIVDFRVLSRDGHTAPGRITFMVMDAK